MIDFLFSRPLWALAVVLNAWLMGFALASLWAIRRWMLPRLVLNTNASLFYGAAVMQSAMMLYGLIAALTAVSVWTKHSQVSDIVSSEATAIASLWRDLSCGSSCCQGRWVACSSPSSSPSRTRAPRPFVIVSLDRPFHGTMAIPADSYRLVHDQLMKR